MLGETVSIQADFEHNNDYELPIAQDKEVFSSLDHIDRSISGVTSNQALNVEIRIKNNEFIVIDDYFTTVIQYLIRSNLVIIVIMIAISVPQFGDMINLVGGVFNEICCFFVLIIIHQFLYFFIEFFSYFLILSFSFLWFICPFVHLSIFSFVYS